MGRRIASGLKSHTDRLPTSGFPSDSTGRTSSPGGGGEFGWTGGVIPQREG